MPSSSLRSLAAVSVCPTFASPVMVTLPTGSWLPPGCGFGFGDGFGLGFGCGFGDGLGLGDGFGFGVLPPSATSAVFALSTDSAVPLPSVYSALTVMVLPLSSALRV